MESFPDPTLVTSSDQIDMLSSFFNANIELNTLYTCTLSSCDPEQYQSTVYPFTNVLVVAQTSNGKLVGGYRSMAYRRPQDLWIQENNDTEAFIFNIDEGQVYYDKAPELNSTFSYENVRPQHYDFECWTSAMCIIFDGLQTSTLSVIMNTNLGPYYLNTTGSVWLDAPKYGPNQNPSNPDSYSWIAEMTSIEAY